MNSQATNTAEQLCDAFAEFEDASQTLSAFYRELEHQVASLTAELSASRAEQVREFAEKERLAARLENLLEALPGGVVVLDQHGRVQEFNPAATDLLGDLVPGESWNLVVARAFAPRWDDGHDISLKDGRGVNIATQALRRTRSNSAAQGRHGNAAPAGTTSPLQADLGEDGNGGRDGASDPNAARRSPAQYG